MDLRLKFNEDEANYDKWRPTYVAELFDEIISYSGINQTKQALEIGMGTGQATLPILQTKCKVTAIEIGEKLATYSKQKFASYSNLKVINKDFENFCGDNHTYDLIYSATAFHWIPEEVGYKKVFNLLKPGGTVALFWNHPFVNRSDDLLHSEIQKIYKQYYPNDKCPVEFTKKDCIKKLEIIKHYGFNNCYSKLFFGIRTFTAEGYIGLLNTYSDHRALPINVKNKLYKEISSVINSFGGKLNLYDTMDLYLAQRPLC